MKEYTVQELKEMIDEKKSFQLIDVREKWELDVCRLDADHIPMGEILERKTEIKSDVPVIVLCKSGNRSCNVVSALRLQLGLTNLHNLEGGILAWAEEIDTSLEKY
ncbi:MAG: rhodanese-like domain-containing protein [Flavobacteriales bacterium]|nr:rhodanese-like domain-containing protein [Flavobacteriales bacterium]